MREPQRVCLYKHAENKIETIIDLVEGGREVRLEMACIQNTKQKVKIAAA